MISRVSLSWKMLLLEKNVLFKKNKLCFGYSLAFASFLFCQKVNNFGLEKIKKYSLGWNIMLTLMEKMFPIEMN